MSEDGDYSKTLCPASAKRQGRNSPARDACRHGNAAHVSLCGTHFGLHNKSSLRHSLGSTGAAFFISQQFFTRRPLTSVSAAFSLCAECERRLAGWKSFIQPDGCVVVEPEHLKKALAQVKRKKEAPGDRWDDCRGPGSLLEGAMARDPSRAPRRHLPAAAGAAGGDAEGIRRLAAARDSAGARPLHCWQQEPCSRSENYGERLP